MSKKASDHALISQIKSGTSSACSELNRKKDFKIMKQNQHQETSAQKE